MNSFVHKLLEYSAHFSSRQIPSSGRVGLLGQTIIAFVILVYFAQLPTVVFLPFCTLPIFPQVLQQSMLLDFEIFYILLGEKWYFSVVFAFFSQ